MIKLLLKDLHFLGGVFIGLGLPVSSTSIFSSVLIDAVIFLPSGALLLIISYYYTFKIK